MADRPMCSRSRNTPTPTTAYALIGSTDPKSRSRFSLKSAPARWYSRRTATNRADLSIAAETSGTSKLLRRAHLLAARRAWGLTQVPIHHVHTRSTCFANSNDHVVLLLEGCEWHSLCE